MFCNTNPELIGQKATEFATTHQILNASDPIKKNGMFYFCMEYAEMDLVD